MKFRNLIAGFAFALLALAGIAPASANLTQMCQGDVSGAATGSRTIGGTLSPVPSGTIYILNGAGCTAVLPQDIGYFQSQGYTLAQGNPSITFVVPVTATGTTSFQIGTLPPSAAITGIYASNTDASHAVTGNISIGTTSGGVDIAAASSLTGGTSSVSFVTDALTLKRVFSVTAGQAIFATAGTSWNTPTTVTITVSYTYF
jgi:hypothetical protein